jgi:rhodanese-related sulfurtransferase
MKSSFMKIIQRVVIALVLTSDMTPMNSYAGPDPVPISAEQAFDAALSGKDPITEVNYGVGSVMIGDVRTPAEYQFQGTAGKVDSMLLKGSTAPIVPDLGKVRFIQEGKYLEYTIGGKKVKTPIDKVAKVETSSIAINIPCATWNQATKEMDPIPNTFSKGIQGLEEDGVQVVITMCNSGGRSTACLAKFVSDDLASRFKAFYEIDRADRLYISPKHKIHLAGLGGFQGSAYNGVYIGDSGFYGRPTDVQPIQGWKQGKPNGLSV